MSSSNSWHIIGATVLGVIGAASMLIIEHFRQERRRHVMSQDLARMDQQLSRLRIELDQLRLLQNKNEKKSRKGKKRHNSIISTTTTSTDEYKSAIDIESSDQEFYDVSDEEVTFVSEKPFDMVLDDIDKNLDSGKTDVIRETLVVINNLLLEYPNSAVLKWRAAKAYYYIAKTCTENLAKQENINKGIEICSSALSVNWKEADVHKWYAILIGSRSDFQSTKDKISDGHLFKKHIDIAIELNPSDPTLHHLLGRFAYEVAGLKWYERKAAAAFFGEPPNATYQDALVHLLKAESLSKNEWKENKMLIGKCHLASGDYKNGISWLTKAVDISSKDEVEEQFDIEIQTLLAKYNSYR